MMLSTKYQKMMVGSLQEEVEEEVEDEVEDEDEMEEEVEEEVPGEDVVKVEGEEQGTFVKAICHTILQCSSKQYLLSLLLFFHRGGRGGRGGRSQN